MDAEKPHVETKNAHFLKGHASWLYCDGCNKTVAYLCYVTYAYFRFSFTCACGHKGHVENRYNGIDPGGLPTGQLGINTANKRYCCEKDASALFSPVPKNLQSYDAHVVCKQCHTQYSISEQYP